MVNRRRRTRKNAEGDDLVGLSGWLYTDLMLGLAVVFLGAAVFFVCFFTFIRIILMIFQCLLLE